MSSSIVAQLTVIVLLGTILFFVAYRLPQVISASALLILIPIQPIDSQYGSANVFLTYIIFVAMLLKGESVRLPLLPQFLILLFFYLLSMSFVHKALYFQHALYVIAVISAYMVLCIAYDLTLRYSSFRGIVNVLVAMNVVLIIYCTIQMAAGPGVKVIPFGINEMEMIPSRDDNRLTGPFFATGVTSEFLVIMIFVISHRLFFAEGGWYRRALIALILANFGFLVATGNRGGFLSLLGGSVLFLWIFRKELGVRRVLQLATTGAILLSLASAVVVTYSDFGVLFQRLGETSVESGIPDTRQQSWPRALKHIQERPILGHGPRYMMQGGEDGMRYPGWEYQPYPHNLYLFLLSTVGAVGLVAFMVFLLSPLMKCWRALKLRNVSLEDRTFVKTGIVIFVVILVDQIKVEFMRIALVDYWHFVFALMGIFVGACHRAKSDSVIRDRSGAGTQLPANEQGKYEEASPRPV